MPFERQSHDEPAPRHRIETVSRRARTGHPSVGTVICGLIFSDCRMTMTVTREHRRVVACLPRAGRLRLLY